MLSMSWIPSKHSKSYLQNSSQYMHLYRDPQTIIKCVPVGGDFDLELRGLLLPIDNGTVRVGCLYLLSIDIDHPKRSKRVLRLRQAQFLVTVRQRMSSQMRYIDPQNLTKLETQLIKLLRSVPEPLSAYQNPSPSPKYILSPELLEERGLVNRNSGHNEGSFFFITPAQFEFQKQENPAR